MAKTKSKMSNNIDRLMATMETTSELVTLAYLVTYHLDPRSFSISLAKVQTVMWMDYRTNPTLERPMSVVGIW